MVRDKLISPSDLRADAQQLLEEGKMPSLDQLLAAVASVRQKYGPKLKAARKLGTDDEIEARGESLAEEEQMEDPIISVLNITGLPRIETTISTSLMLARRLSIVTGTCLLNSKPSCPRSFSELHSTRTSSATRNNRRKGEAAANLGWRFISWQQCRQKG